MKSWIILCCIVGLPLAAAAEYSRRTPVVEAFEKNKDAVVNISTKVVVEVRDSFYRYDFDLFFGPRYRTRQLEMSSLGSGFVIDPAGYIVTNAHVVKRATEITVIMADESAYTAELIAKSTADDVALIKVSVDRPLPAVTMALGQDLLIGEAVLAIGNPFGNQHTLTDGILSAIHREIEVPDGPSLKDLIQTSAPINPGNSGGPLLNINGDVIAINTAINKAAQNIGYAIPIHRLEEILPRILLPDTLARLDFGATVGPVLSLEQIEAGQTSDISGAKVIALRNGGAASGAGVKTGDVITAINGESMPSAVDLCLALLELRDGQRVQLSLLRGGEPAASDQVAFVVKSRPQPDGSALALSLLGLEVKVLTQSMLRRYNIFGKEGDLVVTGIERDSPASEAGVEPGDVISSVDGQQVDSLDALGLTLEDVAAGDEVELGIQRMEATFFDRRPAAGTVTLTARKPETLSL